MKRRSPSLEGFRTLFRRPSFGLAEIAWRWSFGGAATVLFWLSFIAYLDTLPVSSADLFLLRTKNPTLVGRALADIFHGSGPRFVAASVVLGLFLAVMWIVVASWGRAVTVRNLVGFFRQSDSEAGVPYSLRALFALNFFRVAAALAVAAGWIGAFVLADLVSPDKDPAPGVAFFVFLVIFVLAGLAGAWVNWFLSLAALFVVRDGQDSFGAMAAAAGFIGGRIGAVLAVSFWFGLAHAVVFVVASSAAGFPMAFAGVLPGGMVFAGVLAVTLLYFAGADLLYLGRLAAYVCIVEEPEIAPQVMELPGAPQEGVDRSELILSDVPAS